MVITRFAPSPTGHLHIGGARTAIFCWLLARHFGGSFRLRIEDTDTLRSRQEYTDSILASMQWLGLDVDGAIVYQSQRTELYNAAVDKLLATGHAYWCSCTPETVEAMREAARAKGAKPRYDGHCRERALSAGQGHCVRLMSPSRGTVSFDDMVKGIIEVQADELDDMVLRRADGMPTYNMAVVVDDHEMGVSHVVRGDDHVSNTPRQILLYRALGLPEPRFGHVPMILGPDRQKLSKRHGARAVIEYEQDGLLPEALLNYLVRLGWSHGDKEIFSRTELIALFDGTHLNAAASAFDPDKLAWCNAQYIRTLPQEDLARRVLPFIQADGFDGLNVHSLAPMVMLYRERADSLRSLATAVRPLLLSCAQGQTLHREAAVVNKYLTGAGKDSVCALRECFANANPFDAVTLEKTLHDFIAARGLAFKQVGPSLRVALLGVLSGPALPEIMALLGQREVLARLGNIPCEK